MKEKLKAIKIVLFDLDGVLINDSNDENRIDEIIRLLRDFCDKMNELGILVGVITGREADEVTGKIGEIENIKILTSSIDKVSLAQKIIDENNLQCENILFIGDELFDLPLLQNCGVSAAPKSARREVKRAVDFILDSSGAGGILTAIYNLLKNRNTDAG